MAQSKRLFRYDIGRQLFKGPAQSFVAHALRMFARKGPGLLLRDITKGTDPTVVAVIDVIASAKADVLVVQGVDYDLQGLTLTALADGLKQHGLTYPLSLIHI